MIQKIISGGRTGVELAGLDVAIKLGIAHGGWVSRGMRNSEGPLSEKYGLEETAALGFKSAMERNIADSDGTLRFAVETTLRLQRQLLHADLSQQSAFEAASLISSWVALQNIRLVFITGPSASEDKNIYEQVKKILETAFYLEFVKTGLHPEHPRLKPLSDPAASPAWPHSVEDAVYRLKQVLPLKDRAVMANMQGGEIDQLRAGLGDYIKENFGLYTGNTALLRSCAQWGGLSEPLADEACAVILRALWKDLQTTHRLRIIK